MRSLNIQLLTYNAHIARSCQNSSPGLFCLGGECSHLQLLYIAWAWYHLRSTVKPVLSAPNSQLRHQSCGKTTYVRSFGSTVNRFFRNCEFAGKFAPRSTGLRPTTDNVLDQSCSSFSQSVASRSLKSTQRTQSFSCICIMWDCLLPNIQHQTWFTLSVCTLSCTIK